MNIVHFELVNQEVCSLLHNIYEGPANRNGFVANAFLQLYHRYILKRISALPPCFQELTILAYFIQFNFQMTEIFTFEIYAVIFNKVTLCHGRKDGNSCLYKMPHWG